LLNPDLPKDKSETGGGGVSSEKGFMPERHFSNLPFSLKFGNSIDSFRWNEPSNDVMSSQALFRVRNFKNQVEIVHFCIWIDLKHKSKHDHCKL